MSELYSRTDKKTSLFGLQVHGPVFFTSASLILLSIVLTILYRDSASELFSVIQTQVSTKTGWFFILSVNVFLVFVVYLAFSKFVRVRLGGDEAKPEFSTLAWFSMLFSAGMGIGLLFWSIAEPVTHYLVPPLAAASDVQSAQQAMNVTMLHWGFHAWAIYALVGLSLAYFTYSRGLPLTIRSVFYPFFGNRIYSWVGDVIDIFAVLATVFGLATSLGFGVQQVASGLSFVLGIDNGLVTQVSLIAGITLIATISVVSGIQKGVKFLSEMNMRIAVGLLLIIIILGPTVFILNSFIQNTGSYVSHLLTWSTWGESYAQGQWQNSWTVFYWGWWIAWSPFVGTFIARISKGRTIRQFILGVLIVPTIVTCLWISAFGSVSILEVMNGNTAIADAVQNDVSTALFVFLETIPFTEAISVLAIVLVTSFFITSSDSGSLVVDSLTSGGKISAPVGQRIFWATTEGAVAAVLLIGGGLQALQTATIITGLPFAFLLLTMCYSLHKGLSQDLKKKKEAEKANAVTHAIPNSSTSKMNSETTDKVK
ncbi:MAG: BCCT family transporter [Balneolaceae bacterium]|jgi:choline/glycine/proline betaine transport protein|nr:BCCT family transporter [Balneolaceae bacterium]